jgi:hypothetical protein
MKRVLGLLAFCTLGAFIACTSSDPAGSSGGASSGASGDGGTGGEGGSSSGGGTQCTKQRDDVFKPIDKVSSGEVIVVGTSGSAKILYVDASAGGINSAPTRPRTYINLGTLSRVDVTDPAAYSSSDWDLAMKRAVIYTNSGDGGPGKGGAVLLKKGFDSVTAADLDGAKAEKFFDADCNPLLDQNADPASTFAGWYDYNDQTHVPTPKAGYVYGVVGASGKKFKVEITSYSGQKDGGAGTATGAFLLKVQPL